jgi:hypothetical protein
MQAQPALQLHREPYLWLGSSLESTATCGYRISCGGKWRVAAGQLACTIM